MSPLTFVFHHEGVCGSPFFAPPFKSSRVQCSFEFVELGVDVYSNNKEEFPAGTGMTGWYNLVLRTIYQSTDYTGMRI